jgi:hypothetical protein
MLDNTNWLGIKSRRIKRIATFQQKGVSRYYSTSEYKDSTKAPVSPIHSLFVLLPSLSLSLFSHTLTLCHIFFGVELATDTNQLSREHQQTTRSPQRQPLPLSRLAQSDACVSQRPLLWEIDVRCWKNWTLTLAWAFQGEINFFDN